MGANRILQGNQIEGGLAAQKNYILNPNAHKNTTGWATYDDGSAAAPVDGTGGSPTVLTFSRSTSSPLRGVGSFLITTTAADGRGEGVSYDFTIDTADQAKVMAFSFDYAVDVTTTTGDFAVYIYDVTNATLIQPAGYQIQGGVSGTQYKHIGTFQTASNSTSYRLIIHRAVTTATATNLKLDAIVLGPQVVQYGAPVTDWQSYTATLTNLGNATQALEWRRVGDTLYLKGRITIGSSVPTGTITISLPSGLTASSSTPVNIGMAMGSKTTFPVGSINMLSTTTIGILAVGANAQWNATNPVTWAAADYLEINVNAIKLAGWSSTVVMSNDTDTRVVSARIGTSGAPTGTVASSFGSSTTIQFNSVTHDTHSAYAAATGYTIPVSGYYRIHARQRINHSSISVNQEVTMGLYKTGTLQSTGATCYCSNATVTNYYPEVMDERFYNAGDILTIRVVSTGTTPVTASDSSANQFIVEKVTGPSAIAASENVQARYRLTASTANAALATGGTEVIDFDTRDYDSHSAVTTGASWKFTAPISGVYQVSAGALLQAATAGAVNNSYLLYLQKGGSNDIVVGRYLAQTTTSCRAYTNGTQDIRLLAGEYINIAGFQNLAASISFDTGATSEGVISIKRVGNY